METVATRFYTYGFPSGMSGADQAQALADIAALQSLLAVTPLPDGVSYKVVADFQATLLEMYSALTYH